MPPATFSSMLAPHTDGAVHCWEFDGTVWTEPSDADPQHSFRPRYRLPTYFVFSLDKMQVDSIMSEKQRYRSDNGDPEGWKLASAFQDFHSRSGISKGNDPAAQQYDL